MIKLLFEKVKKYFYKKKLKKQIKFWRENPVLFCEEFFGIKLLNLQKEVLRKMLDKNTKDD